MNHSEEINELATALSKAQGAYKTVVKTGNNSFGKAYSTFDDMMTAVRQALTDNGLAFSQMLDHINGTPALTSMLMHESGQWSKSTVSLPIIEGNRGTNAIQAFGSVVTYMKRYAGGAMLSVGGDIDDDGNTAGKVEVDFDAIEPIAPKGKPARQPQTAPKSNGNDWTTDETRLKHFWAWCGKQGLDSEQVHAALEVEHLKDYTKTLGEAKTALSKL